MKKIKIKTLMLTAFVALSASFAGLNLVMAANISAQAPPESEFHDELCGGANLSLEKSNSGCGDTAGTSKLNGLITDIVNIITTIVGIVAVIMIIVGGFKYITSSGDAGRVASAKNTIIYAIVGLIIVALAQVVVRFVLGKVG